MIKIPKRRSKASKKGPNHLFFYGLPKSGKTTICSYLPMAMIVELEKGGADFVEAISVNPKDLLELKELSDQLNPEIRANAGAAADANRLAAGLPVRSPEEIEYSDLSSAFKFIVIDTITVLEEFVKPLANSLFRQTPAGALFDPNADVTTAANGAGWGMLRSALLTVLDWYTINGIRLILIGHVKDKAVTTSAGEIDMKMIDLAGKTGSIIASKCDGIGYIVRDEEDPNKLYADFSTSLGITSGCRIAELANKRILISELLNLDENGKEVKKDETGKPLSATVSRKLVTHWDEIYPDIKKLTKQEEVNMLRMEELEPIMEERKKELNGMVKELKAKAKAKKDAKK